MAEETRNSAERFEDRVTELRGLEAMGMDPYVVARSMGQAIEQLLANAPKQSQAPQAVLA